ncbi:MAG: nucleoside-diphosphate kinase [Spirochaetes bacterium]|nr:nucleoside-diphosphate kinase [Spirochaetota bacterium]
MNFEQTLSIVKPNALEKNALGDIINRFEKSGLKVIAIKMLLLDRQTAAGFYKEHEGQPYFEKLMKFMTRNPIVVQVLEGIDAVAKNREIMGPTSYMNGPEGTIRKDYADDITYNAVHGSDSPESAKKEIAYFFRENEIFPNYSVK